MMFTPNNPISRRGLLGGALGLAAMGALSGCGGSSSSDAPKDQGSAEEGELIVWGAVAPESGPQALVEAFMKKYPKIKVTYTRYVNNEQGILKLDTALQGGVPIDVFFSYGTVDVIRRSQAGLALDLTEMAKGDDLAKQFVEGEPISTKVDGKLFSIPTTHWPSFVVINQDALEKTGMDVPFDWTMDDYHKLAQAMKSGGFDSGAYNPPKLMATVKGGDYLYKEGGQESDFDNPLYKQELEYTMELQKDGSIFSQERISAEQIGSYPQNYFLNGSFPMYLDGTSSLRYIKNTKEYPHDFRTTFRPYPAPKAGEKYWNPGVRGDDVQISAKSQYPSAAWTFVKFWMNEGAPMVAPAGKVSPFAFDNPTPELMEKLFGPDPDKLFDMEAFKKTFFTPEPKLSVRTEAKGFTDINKLKSKIEGEVRLGSKPIDDAIAELKQAADKAIANAS